LQKRALILLALSSVLGVAAVTLMQTVNAPAAPLPVARDVRKVVVTRTVLKFGDQILPENLAEAEFPPGSVPPGSFAEIGDLVKGEPRVALATIQPSEAILASKVSLSGGKASLSSVVSAGMRAMAIRVDDVNGVAGFVTPSDRVDVLLTRGDVPAKQQTETLLQGVKVLAIDQTVNEHADKPAIAKAVTLEVSPDDAQKLTLGSKIGSLSLALRNVGSGEAIASRPFSVADLDPQQPVVKRASAAPRLREIEVIRGSSVMMYSIGRKGVAAPSVQQPEDANAAAPLQ
jgi:pilus assembly protein CpaB